MVRAITIEPVLNGFVCRVGCQTVVVKSVDELTIHIHNYYSKPDEYEARFIKENTVNKMMELPIGPVCCEEERDLRPE